MMCFCSNPSLVTCPYSYAAFSLLAMFVRSPQMKFHTRANIQFIFTSFIFVFFCLSFLIIVSNKSIKLIILRPTRFREFAEAQQTDAAVETSGKEPPTRHIVKQGTKLLILAYPRYFSHIIWGNYDTTWLSIFKNQAWIPTSILKPFTFSNQ